MAPSPAARKTLLGRASVVGPVLGRVILAAGGGYGIAALATALLSIILPLTRAEAVTAATLLSFVVMVAVAISVFAARSLLRALVGVGGAALILAGALWLVMVGPPAGGLSTGALPRGSTS